MTTPSNRRHPSNLDNGEYHLGHVHESEFIVSDPALRAELDKRMDLYFSTPLEMFPFAEQDDQPDWFHQFYEDTIEERFPDDQDLRDLITKYRIRFERAMWRHIGRKRVLDFVLMLLIAAPLFILPILPGAAHMALGLAIGGAVWIVVWCGAYVGLNLVLLFYTQNRLSEESARFSFAMLQRTTDLQRVFMALKAKVDLDETLYHEDGDRWRDESARLMRLLMWIAKRLEYIEKYVQTEMWRVRRQRHWATYGGIASAFGTVAAAVAILGLLPTPHLFHLNPLPWLDLGSFGLKLVLTVVFAVVAVISLRNWSLPPDIVRKELETDNWVRFGDLKLDLAIGDQVGRDKANIVKYRTMWKNSSNH